MGDRYLGWPEMGSSGHTVAIGPAEVIEVRSVTRKPSGERWAREAIRSLCTVPWRWTIEAEEAAAEREEVIPHTPHHDHQDAEPRQERQTRLMRVNIPKAMAREHGHTFNCPRCTAWRLSRETTRKHTEACRDRFDKFMRDKNDPRMIKADTRINDRLAGRLQDQVEEVAGVPQQAPSTNLPDLPEASGEIEMYPAAPDEGSATADTEGGARLTEAWIAANVLVNNGSMGEDHTGSSGSSQVIGRQTQDQKTFDPDENLQAVMLEEDDEEDDQDIRSLGICMRADPNVEVSEAKTMEARSCFGRHVWRWGCRALRPSPPWSRSTPRPG